VATFAFATVMLQERLGCYRVLISLFMLSGVLLITRPPVFFPPDSSHDQGNTTNATNTNFDPYSDHSRTLGYVAAACVPILSAIVSIWTRQCRKVTASVLMFWFAVGSFLVAFGGKI
jgi:drug/metabolite transporter (DMT)-like permease